MVQSANSSQTSSRFPVTDIALTFLTFASFIVVGFGNLAEINWGVNQVDYLPSLLRYLWFALAAGVIVLMITRSYHLHLSDSVSPYLWGEKRLFGRVILLALMVIIFAVFRFDAHVYGDGYIRIANFAQKSKPILRWFEYGGTLVPYASYLIFKTLGLTREAAAIWGYQVVSYLSGLLFCLSILKTAAIVTKESSKRLLFFGLTFSSGLLIFFFGFVENSPILLATGGWFIYFLVKLHHQGKMSDLYWIYGLVVAGLLLDVQGLCLIPAAITATAIFASKKKKATLPGLSAGPVVIIAGVVALYILAHGDIAVANRILMLSGKSPDIDYGIFGANHLLDILNLLFLLVPFFPMLLHFIIRGRRGNNRDDTFISLGILTLSQLVYLFIIDPKNGMARDFNMYGFLLTGLISWGAYSVAAIPGSRSYERMQRYFVPAALLLVLPGLILHLSPEKTIAYLEQYLKNNETKYESALLAFRDYYFVKKDFARADLYDQSAIGRVKGALESQLVNDLYYHDRVDEAYTYANQLVERYPYNATYRMQRANLLKHFKKYDEAEKELATAMKLEPNRPDLYHFLSELYRETSQSDKSYETLLNGEKIDPRNSQILTDLMGYYYRAGSDRKVDSLADIVMANDTTSSYPYMYKGLIAERAGNPKAALDYFEKFVNKNDKLPEVPIIRKRMNSLFLRMQDSTGQKQGR